RPFGGTSRTSRRRRTRNRQNGHGRGAGAWGRVYSIGRLRDRGIEGLKTRLKVSSNRSILRSLNLSMTTTATLRAERVTFVRGDARESLHLRARRALSRAFSSFVHVRSGSDCTLRAAGKSGLARINRRARHTREKM